MDEKKDYMLRVKMSLEDKKKLDVVSRNTGEVMSVVVRGLIREAYEKVKRDN